MTWVFYAVCQFGKCIWLIICQKENLKILKGNQKPQIEERETTQWQKGQAMLFKTLHRKPKIE